MSSSKSAHPSPAPGLVSPEPFRPSRRLCFREIETLDELREHFQIRYQVYRASGFLPERADGLDVDSFDLHSRFLGAFLATGQGERMIGGVRMVSQDESSPLLDHMRRLGIEVKPRSTLFPSQKAFDLSDLVAECESAGLRMAEFSRTVLLPAYRGLGVGQGLVEGVYALALNANVDVGIGSTPPHLRDFYARMGCRLIPRRDTAWYADLSTDALALVIDLHHLPDELAAATRRCARQLAAHGVFAL